MPHIVEPTMHEVLWTWLDDRGYTVNGEVTLGEHGIIDLVAYDDDRDIYIGIELKDSAGVSEETVEKTAPIVGEDVTKEVNHPGREWYIRPWGQIAEYHSGGFFDELYFASQAPEVAYSNRDNTHVQSAFEGRTASPEDVGTIKIEDPVEGGSVTQEQGATTLQREQTLELQYKTESWVQHYVWEEIGGIREAVIPNHQTRTVRRLDVMSFTGSDDPTEIYYDQPASRIIGVEAKGRRPVRSDPEGIREQLEAYEESGVVTDLYLAAPDAVKHAALEILSAEELSSVGLYTVDEGGEFHEIKSASFTPLRYDGIRTKNGSYIDIGWGRFSCGDEKTSEEYTSVFDLGQSF